MGQRAVEIPNGWLKLEGVLFEPEGGSQNIVVVCHPHPQSGGEMRNNVVMAVVQALIEGGISGLAFNFRGVGASEGGYDNGIGEQDDVRAAIAFAKALPGVEHVGLAGYSFGAGMAAATVDESVVALALVSAPSGRLGGETRLSSFWRPVLLISGDADHVSSVEALEQVSGVIPGGCEVVVVPGADHFWWGHEARLREVVRGFFVKAMADE